MLLQFCPNCRETLPDRITTWVCLRVLPKAPAKSDESSLAVVGASDMRFSPDAGRQVLYNQQGIVCMQFNSAGDTCKGCEQPKSLDHSYDACPYCREEIPDLEGIESKTLTLTGPSNAGKTCYILALDNWWTKYLHRFQLTVRPVMGQRRKDDFRYLKSMIFSGRKPVENTPAGSMISYTWCIRDRNTGADGCLVTFPDVSGENLRDSISLVANKHYHHTTGIIFLLDAQRMQPGQADTAYRDPQDHYDVAEAMIRDMERRHRGPDGRAAMAEIPIAICVNKTDILRELSGEWENLLREYKPGHDGYFDWVTCSERSNEIRKLLYEDSATGAAVGLLESTFNQIMFFPVATIGCGDKEDIAVNPQGVEDPLLYLLHLQDFIGSNSAD